MPRSFQGILVPFNFFTVRRRIVDGVFHFIEVQSGARGCIAQVVPQVPAPGSTENKPGYFGGNWALAFPRS